MRIRLLAFATAADALGAGSVDYELPAGSRVADLERRLEQSHPDLAALWPRLAVAVDGRLATPESPLAEGVEVALLPPVSGGKGPPPVALVDGPIDTAALESAVADPGCGALVLFVGRVRDHHRGRPVLRLTYDAYRPMAASALERIVAELEAGREGLRMWVVHRLGEVAPGEASVVIAALSPHRAAAFEASREALERLKREVPIWKREHYGDGAAEWREEEPLISPRSTP